MAILEEPILAGFEAELMSCPQASHANQVPLPGSVEARAMTVGCGRQLSTLLDQSGPLGAFSKILLESSHWTNSEEYCYVWQILDTRFELSAFQLTPWGQSIEDSGSLLLPTATANDWKGLNMSDSGTASANSLSTQAAKLWPTPRKEGYDSQGKGHGDLQYEVKNRLWPTPTERDWKSTSHGNQGNARPLSEVAGLTSDSPGSLNPRFVEELMGFPIDHTALRPSATPWSRSKPAHSSKQSHK